MKKKIFIWEIERELFWVKWLKMGIARVYLSCNYSCIMYFKVKILLVKLKKLYTSANLNPNHGTRKTVTKKMKSSKMVGFIMTNTFTSLIWLHYQLSS